MSRSKPENRLMLHLDIKRKRVQLSVVGVVGIITVCLVLQRRLIVAQLIGFARR